MLGSGLVFLIVVHVRDFNCRPILDQRLLRWVESKMIIFKNTTLVFHGKVKTVNTTYNK